MFNKRDGAAWVQDLFRDGWRVLLYVVLIVLCVLFAPEQSLRFIYTEF